MKISVVMPVCACPDPQDFSGGPHPHFFKALDSIVNAGHDDVEILMGADGNLPRVRESLAAWSSSRGGRHPAIAYHEYSFSGRWGNLQRNLLLQEATGDMVCFQDQDDEFFPNALAEVNQIAGEHPGRPLIFRMAAYQSGTFGARQREPSVLWQVEGCLELGQIGGHMIVVPNVKHLLGQWKEDAYAGDWFFINDTLQRFAAESISPCWRGEFISILRPWARAQ